MDPRHELEQFRRSAAMGGGLTPENTRRLLDMVEALLEERAEVRQLLDQLGPPWRNARDTLNRLSRLVR
ncbi:MAG TPA: hypothetical protein VGK49_09440 [Ilumatobacteraceae bacterium]